MSIKIYDGLKLKTSNTKIIDEYVNQVKKKLLKKIINKDFSIFLKYLFFVLDQHSLHKESGMNQSEILQKVEDLFNEEFYSIYKLKNSDIKLKAFNIKSFNIDDILKGISEFLEIMVNFENYQILFMDYKLINEISLEFIPVSKNKTLLFPIYFISNSNLFSKGVLENKYCQKYEYYDNTDKPKNISYSQWKIRENDWKENYVYGKNTSIVFEIFGKNEILNSLKKFKKHINRKTKFLENEINKNFNIETRARKLAREKIVSLKYKEAVNDKKIKFRKDISDKLDTEDITTIIEILKKIDQNYCTNKKEKKDLINTIIKLKEEKEFEKSSFYTKISFSITKNERKGIYDEDINHIKNEIKKHLNHFF